MSQAPRAHLAALGCRLNEAELQQWTRKLRARGWAIAADPAQADLIVLNSCAVTAEATRKSRQQIRRLRRESPGARLVVTGCAVSLDPEQARETLAADLVVTNDGKDDLVELAARALDLPQHPQAASDPHAASLYGRGRHRAFVKVQDGCRHRCSFCIVTVARGEERSRSLADVVEEINTLVTAGVQEAVLTGVHVGGYGADLGIDLAALVDAVLADTDLPRLRFASVEPWDLPEDFFARFENPRLMPHMHLPLQSGADSVLKRMARRCRRTDFRRLAAQARGASPEFNITTDVIVGFPGETETEWQQTLEFCEEIGFGQLHVFPYSPREGTAAARMPNSVPTDVKLARAGALRTLSARLTRSLLLRQIGREEEVLWEPRPRQATCAGYTRNYLRVEPSSQRVEVRSGIEQIRLTGLSARSEALRGVPLNTPIP